MLYAQSGGTNTPAGGAFIATLSKGAGNGRKSEFDGLGDMGDVILSGVQE